MADARALGVFQERVKSLLGSLLEVLLLEITEACRESLCRSRCECLMRNNDTWFSIYIYTCFFFFLRESFLLIRAVDEKYRKKL